MTGQFYEARVDVIQLVLRAMRLHPEEFHIQMAATACVYNLTKGDIGQKVHPHILREVVHFTLVIIKEKPAIIINESVIISLLCNLGRHGEFSQ